MEDAVPRYYFDIQGLDPQQDEDGMECENVEVALERIMTSLPDLAELITPDDCDNQSISVIVRDEEGRQVYMATLTFSGKRLVAEASR